MGLSTERRFQWLVRHCEPAKEAPGTASALKTLLRVEAVQMGAWELLVHGRLASCWVLWPGWEAVFQPPMAWEGSTSSCGSTTF